MHYLVLGAGRMSYGIVHDLLHHGQATQIDITDNSAGALERIQSFFDDRRLSVHNITAQDGPAIREIMSDAAGAISAVPYEFNAGLTRHAISTGCHFVDLGGNNDIVEEQFLLNDEAKRAGVGIVPDCGLAPGMTSVVVARIVKSFERTARVEIRVGGLPLHPRTPLNYMLVFSVHGLTNEYLEPALILENGEIRTVPSLSAEEEIEFPQPFGRLEAFYTSGGTSTLPLSFEGSIKDLNYKTIRYPGHCSLFRSMVDLGFLEEQALHFDGVDIPKRTVFEKMLTEPLNYDGEDVVLIRVTGKGISGGSEKTIRYQAIEYGDKKSGLTAMMRTTAFPAALTLEMLVRGDITQCGVLRQEQVIPGEQYLAELEKRDIYFDVSERAE